MYQPLLGWQSRLTKKWIQQGGPIIDPRIKQILDGRIKPGPKQVLFNHPLEFIADPLEPGSGKSPFTVMLTRELNSELLKIVQAKVQQFVENHDGRLPDGAEWNQLIEINNLMDAQNGDLRLANDRHREGIHAAMIKASGGGPITPEMVQKASHDHLAVMQYESQIAAFLLFHAEAQPGHDPNLLKQLFIVKVAPSLDELLWSPDPLASIDPTDTGGALSPVGFVHLYRQYFFDLGTFLGEPIEHVWLAPGTTIELVEVSTRRTLVEQQTETLVETITKSEHSETMKDELSDAVKEENQNSTKLGVTQTNTVNAFVYQGTVSANFGLESTRRQSREIAHKQSREQSEKLSTEIKRSVKTLFRTVTETTDTRSRRYVLQNTTGKLINYELRRKMRRVGVQLQSIGERLCWQVFVDDPGAELGVARLVHIAEPADLSQIHAPDVTPYPPPVKQALKLLLSFQRYHGDNDTGNMYIEDGNLSETGHLHLGDENDKIKVNYRGFRVSPPPGYRLANVQLKNVVGDHYLDPVFFNVTDTTFDVHLKQAFFPVEGRISAEVELEFLTTKTEMDRIDKENETKKRETDLEQRRKIKEAYVKAIRERIKLASKIQRRASWDLREEERTVVYRRLLQRLMLDSWQKPGTPEQRRINHVRSEVIRSIFDIDSMLYFVAPEWWVPRLHRSRQNFSPSPALDKSGNPIPVADSDPVGWGGTNETGRDNYDITEDSAPARLGSSLGWLLQLDGDNLRNAFLNAPWVKAVVPIRPGREKAALNWLKSLEGHDKDGWETPYLGNDDPEFTGKKIGEVLEIVADRLEKRNGNIEHVLQADKVFEHGFDHLAKGFDAGVEPSEVFSQYISVLPTDQIVAVEYEPTDLLV